jgi:B12 binding domain
VLPSREFGLLSPAEVNLRIRTALGRKLVVVGATVGTDAHTVGIDAILNVKGHAGEKGLEYYREIRVVNMGAQVPVSSLVARAATERADAVLVSQVVTQWDAHLVNAREPGVPRGPGVRRRSPGCSPRSDVQFRAPVLAGDVLEATCVVTSVGRRSRQLSFEARVVCRADPSRGPSSAVVLDEPVVVVTAVGMVVVPAP